MRIFVGILLSVFVLYVSLNAYGQERSDYKAQGYKKVVRTWSSLWRQNDCEKDAHYGEFCSYFRFYVDGTVIGVTTSGNPREIKKWFHRPYGDTGKYNIKESEIRFSLTSRQGTIDYEGVIDADVLTLKIFSHINQYQHSETYSWVKPRKRTSIKK